MKDSDRHRLLAEMHHKRAMYEYAAHVAWMSDLHAGPIIDGDCRPQTSTTPLDAPRKSDDGPNS